MLKKEEKRLERSPELVSKRAKNLNQGVRFVDNRAASLQRKAQQAMALDGAQQRQRREPWGNCEAAPLQKSKNPVQFVREWATGKVDKALDEAAGTTGNPDIDTGHHKASKSAVMERVFNAMTSTQWSRTVETLDLEPGSGVNALKSLGSNLALGPASGKRFGDPNRGFDPNVTSSGTLTPRSSLYEDLIEFLDSRTNPDEKFNQHEFDTVLGMLEMAEKIHFQKTGGELIDPDISMWSQGDFPGGKTWTRTDNAPSYDVDYEELAENSVRDLKASKHRATKPKEDFVIKLLPKVARSMVSRHSMPLDQESLDRWKQDGFTRFYRQSDHSWYFLDKEEAAKVFLKDPDYVLAHFPDTPEMERELYGFELLRPFA